MKRAVLVFCLLAMFAVAAMAESCEGTGCELTDAVGGRRELLSIKSHKFVRKVPVKRRIFFRHKFVPWWWWWKHHGSFHGSKFHGGFHHSGKFHG